MTDVLTVSSLRKSYDGRSVLHGLSFHVRSGETVALLGANGAGKTTTLECIEGVRRPDGGSVQVRGRLAAQLQTGSLPAFLRGSELIELFARSNRVQPDRALAARLGVDAFAGRQYRAMSTGQQRRLQLVLALMRRPDLLLLDEPTAGLDVEGRLSVHAEIAALRSQGTAVLLSTHDLTEVKDLCDRLILLRGGTVAFDGTPAEFSDSAGMPAVLRIRTPLGTESFPAEGDLGAVLADLLPQFRQRDLPILDVQVERGTLEEQFMKLAEGE